jgi:hypothetical protein
VVKSPEKPYSSSKTCFSPSAARDRQKKQKTKIKGFLDAEYSKFLVFKTVTMDINLQKIELSGQSEEVKSINERFFICRS